MNRSILGISIFAVIGLFVCILLVGIHSEYHKGVGTLVTGECNKLNNVLMDQDGTFKTFTSDECVQQLSQQLSN